MAQTIITQFVNPTAKRGPRIKVKGWINSALYQWDEHISVEENHAVAAGHYVYELNKGRTGDDYQWQIVSGGDMPDSSGYAFIIDLKA
jgi:hypothetical protein